MKTNLSIPTDQTVPRQPGDNGREEPLSQTALLLPVPDQEDVAHFITLYRSRYAVELEPEKAYEILGGLMRFLYLTSQRTEEPAPGRLDG